MITFTAFLMALLCAGNEIRLSVAPDQPVPYVYVDDPLILEILSDKDTTANISLEVTSDYGTDPVNLTLDPIVVRARGTQWRTVDGIPAERGLYRIHARVEAEGAVSETEAAFCRVDRPVTGYVLPVCAATDRPDGRLLLAAKGISAPCVRLSAGLSDFAQRMDEVTSQFVERGQTVAGFQVVVLLDASSADSAGVLAKSLGDRVARWDVDAKSPESLVTISKALRREGTKAPVALVVKNAQAVSTMLAAGVGQAINALVYSGEPQASRLQEIRNAAQRAGYEGVTLHASIPKVDGRDASQGPRLCRQILSNLAGDVVQTEIDSALIFTVCQTETNCDDGFGPGYVYLAALAHQLKGTTHVGEMDLGNDVSALGFRRGPEWMLAMWTGEASKDISLRVENAAELALYDARNNPLPAPELKNGSITVALVQEPRFLAGKAGSVLTQTALNAVRKSASGILESEGLRGSLPSEVVGFVKKFSTLEPGGYNRLEFFSLLKSFPRIEEMWHTGAMSRSVAVPTLAALHRIARSLCIIEQERGEAFVEPLQKTLGNCGQFQSLYLTSSAATPESRERPDWLLDMVGRLMAEAEHLNEEGRAIEACSVATLAEWRARALEIAAKAQPLSQPEKEVKPPEAAHPKEEKKEKPKAAKPEASSKQKQTAPQFVKPRQTVKKQGKKK